MKKNVENSLSVDMAKAGYTENLLNYLKGKSKDAEFSYKEMEIFFNSKEEKILKDKVFIKKFEFLKTITEKDWNKKNVKEAKNFLENDYRIRDYFWSTIPIDLAISKTDSLLFLSKVIISNPDKKEDCLLNAKKVLRNTMIDDNKDNRDLRYNTLISYWKMTKKSNYQDYVQPMIDIFLENNPKMILNFSKEGIISDDVRLKIVTKNMTKDQDFIKGNQYHGIFNTIKSLFEIYYLSNIFIDFLIEYIQKTDFKKEKSEALIYMMIDIIKKNNNQNLLKSIWFPLLEECSKHASILLEYFPFLLRISKNKKIAYLNIFKNSMNIYGDYLPYQENYFKDTFSFLNKCGLKEDFDLFIFEKIKNIIDNKSNFSYNLQLIMFSYNLLDKKHDILALGLDILLELQDDPYEETLTEFLNLLKKENKEFYLKAINVTKERFLKKLLSKDRKNKDLTSLILKHF